MNSKQWLSRAKNIDREIDGLMRARDETKARCLSITQSYTGNIVQSTKDPHKFDSLVELENEIDKRVDELIRVKAETVGKIAKLNDGRYREVLYCRYIEGLTFEEISVRIKYSYKQTCRLHGRALIEMGVILNENANKD